MRDATTLILAALLISPGALLAATGNAAAATGGPDGFGYTFADSAEPDGPSFNFTDISSTGTELSSCDDCMFDAISIGFDFAFYGNTRSDVSISTNGFISFTSGQSSGCCSGDPIPSTSSPDDLVAGYWEDLNPSSGGSIDFQTVGTSPDRVFIVQFTDVPHYFDDTPVTFQFKLFESDDRIEVHYADASSDGGTHTGGIESPDGTTGLEYFHGDVSLNQTAVRYSLVPAPTAPTVEGPNEVRSGRNLTLNATATDPEGRDVAYHFDWGDGTTERVPTSGYVASGTEVQAQHAFADPGTYPVQVTAENTAGRTSEPTPHPVNVTSNPPSQPAPPGAPPIGTTLVDVEVTVNASDPDGDDLAVFVDWGDGTVQRVPSVGYVASGTTVEARHRYDATGTYNVTAWAVDIHGAAGPASEASTVEVIL